MISSQFPFFNYYFIYIFLYKSVIASPKDFLLHIIAIFVIILEDECRSSVKIPLHLFSVGGKRRIVNIMEKLETQS